MTNHEEMSMSESIDTPELPERIIVTITARGDVRKGITIDVYGSGHPSEGEINEDDLLDTLHVYGLVTPDVREVYVEYDPGTHDFAIMDIDTESTIGRLAVAMGAGA